MHGDVLLFNAHGLNSQVLDCTAKGHFQPKPDEQQNVLVESVDVHDSLVEMVSRRKMDTGDTSDFVIPLETWVEMGFAYNLHTSDLAQKHEQH